MVTETFLNRVLRAWGLALGRVLHDEAVTGSPQRTQLRLVVEDSLGRRLVLEKIAETDLHHKTMIAETLETLGERGMTQVRPYLRNRDNGFIACVDHQYWQAVPHVPGVVPDRPACVHDRWRGTALSGFLLDLWQATAHGVVHPCLPADFSITGYIGTLVQTLNRHRPELLMDLSRVLNWLGPGFRAAHDCLPRKFCHGDLHPLNIIWSDSGISAVIDWEFLGYKPEVYDIANLVGCLGMEDPHCLAGDLVLELVGCLRASGIISPAGWRILPQFLCAVRFAWLAEWLRNTDREMIALETTYMKLIMDHAPDLNRLWTN